MSNIATISLGAFCALNVITNFLVLAAASRLLKDHDESTSALIQGHNRTASALKEQSDVIVRGLDLIAGRELQAAQSSDKGGHVR